MPSVNSDVPGTLPPELQGFVGRGRELGELKDLLGTSRLVTLIGVDFLLSQEVHTADMLAYLVMTSLGLQQGNGSAVPELIEYLTGRQVLLVLDNCEHLLPACAVLVDALLRVCLGLKVVATSRESLAVRGEVLYPVTPLSVPEPTRQQSAADMARINVQSIALLEGLREEFSGIPTVVSGCLGPRGDGYVPSAMMPVRAGWSPVRIVEWPGQVSVAAWL